MSLFDEVLSALAERRVSIVCPSCGEQDWKGGYGELGNLHGSLPLVTEHGDLVETPSQRGGMPLYPLICTNCGLVRLYSLAILGLGS